MHLTLLQYIERCPARALLSVPAGVMDRSNGPWRSEVFRRVLAALPPQVELVAAGHPETLKRLASWLDALQRPRAQFVRIESSVDFTSWCQDAFLPARDEAGAPALILSARPARQADAIVARAVAEATGTPCVWAPFQFEGGNVVVGEEFVFVGRDTLGGDKDGDLLRALGILGERRRICLMGARVELPRSEVRLRHQPIFHIDAFVSIAGRGPNGRERVLVATRGSPQRGFEWALQVGGADAGPWRTSVCARRLHAHGPARAPGATAEAPLRGAASQ